MDLAAHLSVFAMSVAACRGGAVISSDHEEVRVLSVPGAGYYFGGNFGLTILKSCCR